MIGEPQRCRAFCRAVEIKIIEDIGKNNMHINDFDYELPQELIAQTPAQKRDCSRLMVVDRKTGEVAHKHFYDIIEELKPTDCLVLNNSKVLPARLYGRHRREGRIPADQAYRRGCLGDDG